MKSDVHYRVHKSPPLDHIDFGFLGCNAASTCRQIPTFRRNILPQSLALKMETVCVSEMLVSIYKSTRHYGIKLMIVSL
jgi:hypothetical protein